MGSFNAVNGFAESDVVAVQECFVELIIKEQAACNHEESNEAVYDPGSVGVALRHLTPLYAIE